MPRSARRATSAQSAADVRRARCLRHAMASITCGGTEHVLERRWRRGARRPYVTIRLRDGGETNGCALRRGLAVRQRVPVVARSTPNGGESKPTPTTATGHFAGDYWRHSARQTTRRCNSTPRPTRTGSSPRSPTTARSLPNCMCPIATGRFRPSCLASISRRLRQGHPYSGDRRPRRQSHLHECRVHAGGQALLSAEHQAASPAWRKKRLGQGGLVPCPSIPPKVHGSSWRTSRRMGKKAISADDMTKAVYTLTNDN